MTRDPGWFDGDDFALGKVEEEAPTSEPDEMWDDYFND